jgi:hypothetical protein
MGLRGFAVQDGFALKAGVRSDPPSEESTSAPPLSESSPAGNAPTALTDAFAALKDEIAKGPSDLSRTKELRAYVGDRLDDFTQAAHVVVVRSRWGRRRKGAAAPG